MKKTYIEPLLRIVKIGTLSHLAESGPSVNNAKRMDSFDSKGYAGGIEFDDDEVGRGAGTWE